MTLVSVKLKIIDLLLSIIRKPTMRLLFYRAKYAASGQANQFAKNKNFDLRKMGERMKAVMLHDQDIIDKRWAECEKCEHLVKATKQCDVCKCFMKVKTRVATSRCPLDPPKWDREYNFKEGKAVNGSAVTTEL
tara:strand:+ start:606 stop:1007 length:402 start_codon:yes stop_codon:yes gene_type:complete